AGDHGFLELFRIRLARGRGFTPEDDIGHARVCVVGYLLAQKLWDGDAVGHWLTIHKVRCLVVGQLADQDRSGANFGFDYRHLARLPLSTAIDIDPALKAGAAYLIKTDGSASNQIVKRILNALLSSRHHGVDDFQIFDMSGVMERFTRVFSVMQLIVGF